MTDQPGPYDLDETRLIMAPDGEATPKKVTPTFFEELDTEFGGFAGHVLFSKFSFSEDWPTWEIHPKGDEAVYLLEGDTDFVLWRDGKETSVRVNGPGSYVVVPKGTWHTARPHAPTTMLFVTPGEGTLNQEEPS